MYLNGNDLSRLYIGNKSVNKAFIGDIQVFPLEKPKEATPVTWSITSWIEDKYGGFSSTHEIPNMKENFIDYELNANSYADFSIKTTLLVDTTRALVLTDTRDGSTEELYNGYSISYESDKGVMKIIRTGASSLRVEWRPK